VMAAMVSPSSTPKLIWPSWLYRTIRIGVSRAR
jgi:hypothetical protein